MDTVEKIVSLLYEQEWSAWVHRLWMYDLEKEVFEIAVREYIETWVNHLTEYDNIKYLYWRAKYGNFHTEISMPDIEIFDKCIREDSFWNIKAVYNKEDLDFISYKVEMARNEHRYLESYSGMRKKAQAHISNKKNRERIFSSKWAICVFCWSTDKLSVDHIAPVSKWWGNEDENLQILCKSCNSKKSNKTDYANK